MPIYEYKCKKCGEKFELRLGFFHNRKSLKCPTCGSEDPDRVFSPFAMGGSNQDSPKASSGNSCSPRSFG
jgi:putative FmdB family regulatory protein